jgi:hypothetical protein
MWIGSALVLIFILYLIDKHNQWRLVLRLVIGLVLLCILTVGGFWGWQQYQDYRQEKEEQAEAAAKQVRFSACVSRLNQIPVPKDAAVADVPNDIQAACYANPNATVYPYSPVPSSPLVWTPVLPKARPKLKTESQPQSQANCDVVPCSDWAAVTSWGEIRSDDCFDTDSMVQLNCKTIAVLNKGDRVQIVSEKTRSSGGWDIYKVKFQQWTGWTEAEGLSPERGEGK